MREALRGYAAACLESLDQGELSSVGRELSTFASALDSSGPLGQLLADNAIEVAVREAVVRDLLSSAQAETTALVVFVVRNEPASEVVPDSGWLAQRASDEPERRSSGVDPDPPAGHHAVNERLEGYALALFERVASRQTVDEVEDQLFRMTRIVEATRPLRQTLADLTVPASIRQDLVNQLIGDQAEPATIALLRYAVAQNRGDLVSHLDWLVDKVAEERGRRLAQVSSAVELDEDQRRRLVRGLSERTGRQVSLQVSVEPELVGGVRIVVGDTVLDGTVRRRLELVRAALARGTRPRSS